MTGGRYVEEQGFGVQCMVKQSVAMASEALLDWASVVDQIQR